MQKLQCKATKSQMDYLKKHCPKDGRSFGMIGYVSMESGVWKMVFLKEAADIKKWNQFVKFMDKWVPDSLRDVKPSKI